MASSQSLVVMRPSNRAYGVEHVRVDDTNNQTTQVVQVSSQDDGLCSKSGRGNFGDEGVADGSDSEIVQEGEGDQESSDRPSAISAPLGDRAEDADEQHQGSAGSLTVEEEGSSTERLHDEPRSHSTDEADNEHAQVEGGGSRVVETGLLEEIGSLSHQR